LPEAAKRALRTEALVSGYVKKQILNGVSIEVLPGEIVALIGHNGSGKSTLLKSVFGIVPIWNGRVFVGDNEIATPSPREMIGAGVAYVPQGNRVFGDLTVYENFEVGAVALKDRKKLPVLIDSLLSIFPPLATRLRQRAATLSGGEKQMLALASVLLLSPQVLLLDEPSLGLAPPAARQALQHIHHLSRNTGISTLIVEQKVRAVLEIATHVYVLRNGAVSFAGRSELLQDEVRLRQVYL
jgi:branched-chain amino acid transport system ATP-binding protein